MGMGGENCVKKVGVYLLNELIKDVFGLSTCRARETRDARRETRGM